MNAKKISMFVILSLSIATAVVGTTGSNIVSPVFAGGDHDEKKCKNNEDNNCNDTEKNQKLSAKDECDNENTVKHHSDDNNIDNILICSIDAVNLKDSVLVNSSVFGDAIEPIFE